MTFKSWKTLKGSLSTPLELCSLPPTNEAVELHILHAQFQIIIWKQNCHEPPQLNPCEYGWTRDMTTKFLLPTMFTPSAKPIPDNILILIACNCKLQNVQLVRARVYRSRCHVVNFVLARKKGV